MASGIVKVAQRLHRMTENYILYADLETRRLSGTGTEHLLGFSGGADVTSAAMDAAAHDPFSTRVRRKLPLPLTGRGPG